MNVLARLRLLLLPALAGVICIQCGCGGGGGGGTDSGTPASAVTGQVLLPNGSLASLARESAKAQLAGASTAITVTMANIDAAGNAVSPAIATATTGANGNFTITVSSAFQPAANVGLFVGAGSTRLRSIVTGFSGNMVRPASEAAMQLLLTQIAGRTALVSVRVNDAINLLNAVINAAGGSESGSNISSSVSATRTQAQGNAGVTAALNAISNNAAPNQPPVISSPTISPADLDFIGGSVTFSFVVSDEDLNAVTTTATFRRDSDGVTFTVTNLARNGSTFTGSFVAPPNTLTSAQTYQLTSTASDGVNPAAALTPSQRVTVAALQAPPSVPS